MRQPFLSTVKVRPLRSTEHRSAAYITNLSHLNFRLDSRILSQAIFKTLLGSYITGLLCIWVFCFSFFLRPGLLASLGPDCHGQFVYLLCFGVFLGHLLWYSYSLTDSKGSVDWDIWELLSEFHAAVLVIHACSLLRVNNSFVEVDEVRVPSFSPLEFLLVTLNAFNSYYILSIWFKTQPWLFFNRLSWGLWSKRGAALRLVHVHASLLFVFLCWCRIRLAV